jgi:tetratricopeptide (TPR) repeat protein
MKAEDVARRAGDGFSSEVDKLGTITQAAKAIGRSANFFIYQLQTPGGAGLSWPQALLSLEKMGHPMPEEVVHTAMARLDADPALILLAAREHQGIAADLYFREARPRLEALIEAGATAEGAWSSRAAKIKKLDKLRRSDRELAKEKLQVLISHALDRLEETGLRPRQAFVDLAAALGVLAALQRLAGRRDDAMDLLLVARPLCWLTNDFVAEGEWFVKAAFLLMDLSREVRACQFLVEAHTLFFLGGAPARQAATVVVRGRILKKAGLYEASRRILEPVLALLPPDDVEGRLSCHQSLATNYQELGDLPRACEHLAAAIELVGDDLLAKASCLCSRARLLQQLGDAPGALSCFEEALPLYAKLTGAGELAELAMEYAAVLLKEGRRPELRRLAADLSGWIQQLRGNRKLRDIGEDFTGLVELNDLNEESLAEILERIQETKPPSFRRTVTV